MHNRHTATRLYVCTSITPTGHYIFYIRDDISYQLPGKGDTIIAKDDLGNITTYRKRLLFYNLCENYELFTEENKNVNLNRSVFAVLRPPFVVPQASLAHRICVYL
ncbi:unnamed protein product [Didymodactylos carnosus]|uniref:Uncharacterized protein n=1 Tax=Didymodactylos carnosus TaxID=1234261 RepID=A0A815FS42_9BILA|nr:unnamed protein product [Didymodactylos carnosus]CAF1329899.1 unnamed protein product [Didymodactylos carnosus]CAF3880023.1 unnamed protein product [Didymodactylos carnosus]CAF4182552.1 unnamed protein product [Didymodactylos carnosus]